WAAGHDGHGNRVHADVQAAAVKAVAQWEAAKAAAHGKGRNAGMTVEARAPITAASENDLPDSAFAYIEPGGKKDAGGRTVPRSKRHFPIHDAAHVRNALARASQSPFGAKAMPKIRAAAKKFGIHMSDSGRSVPVHPVERRYTASTVGIVLLGGEEARDGTRSRRIGGYAAKFNTYSRDLGHFVEEIDPGFFNKSKGDGWPGVICRFNHENSQLLGTIQGRTLGLNVDRDGLVYDVDPPPSMSHVLEYVERGDVQKSSFAFRAYEEDWGTTEDGGPLRKLYSGQLVDVAPVVDPAYIDTTAGLRSFAAHFDADFEEVRAMAEQRELRRFFARTDRSSLPPQPKITGTEAMMKLMERRRDPWA
ncbi:MAG TPA: HK97 family phage prohead protease, partial [Gemmataceae bacterium]|nr:HK97 family phage prohead protease [Gemmataceae bacterium]